MVRTLVRVLEEATARLQSFLRRTPYDSYPKRAFGAKVTMEEDEELWILLYACLLLSILR